MPRSAFSQYNLVNQIFSNLSYGTVNVVGNPSNNLWNTRYFKNVNLNTMHSVNTIRYPNFSHQRHFYFYTFTAMRITKETRGSK